MLTMIGIENNNNTDLNEKTFEQLLLIAESNGISIDRKYEKEEIIEKILIVEQVKRNHMISNEIANNINSFNKTNIAFKITQSIDEGEWSFWRIFRNKFIFRRIMSFLDSHISTSYDSITAVHLMIKNKQFNYLKDKIIRNQYLKFSPHNGMINRNVPDNIGDIFQNFRNDENDVLFYKQLFKYYNKHILEFNSTEVYKRTDKRIDQGAHPQDGVIKNDREKLVNKIIGKRNLVALKVMVEEYNYIPTKSNLQYAISTGSLKILKFILDPIYNLQVNIHQFEFTIKDQIQFKNCIKSFNFLHNQNLLKSNYILPFILKNNSFVNPSISLETLIIIVKLILEPFKEVDVGTKIINQNDIESFLNQITKSQLKSTLDEKENNKLYSSTIQEMLYAYYRFIHTCSGSVENSNLRDTIVNSIDEFYLDFKLSFQKANPLIINSIFRSTGPQIDLYATLLTVKIKEIIFNEFEKSKSNDGNLTSPEFTFSNCTSKEDQLEFINLIIGKLKKSKLTLLNDSPKIPVTAILFFYLIINYDDLELIEYVASELSVKLDMEITFYQNFPNYGGLVHYEITRFIKSTSTLDWLYINFKHHFGKSCWLYFKSLRLLKHYQSLVTFSGGDTVLVVSFPVKTKLDNCSKEIIDYIVDCGPSIFEFNKITVYAIIDQYYNDYGYMVKYKMFKIAYLSYGFSSPTSDSNNTLYQSFILLKESFGFIKFVNWLYENYNHRFEIDDGSSGSSLSGDDMKFFDIKTRLDNILFNISRYTLISLATITLSTTSFEKENIKMLDWLLNLIFNQIETTTPAHPLISYFTRNSHFGLIEMLFSIVKNGNLKSLEFVFQKYNFILLKKSNTNNGLFDHKKLNNLLLLSLNYDHIEQSEFLFYLFTISKDEFYSNAGPLSTIYFKSKFK